MRFRTLLTTTILGLLISLAAALGAGSAAQAAETPNPQSTTGTTFAYWSYWNGQPDGTWAPSSAGADTETPADGSVLGWRWGPGQSGTLNQPPRSTASFSDICSATPAQSEKKRVGVVIDFGTPAVAPADQEPPANVTVCVVAGPTANGLQITADAAETRSTPEGMVCGLNGYPATGCGGPVSAASAAVAAPVPSADTSNTTASTSSPNWVSTGGGVLILIVLIVVGVLVARKRTSE